MSCGIASIIMCVFKINKLRPGADALKVEQEIYDLYTSASGSKYNPATQGTKPEHLATVLNQLNCGSWKGMWTSAATLSKIVHDKVGVAAGLGPTVNVNPVIAGVGWSGGGGHATVVDTIRQFGGKLYATVCDPWDTNVHVVSMDPGKPFDYKADEGGFSFDFWGTHKGQAKPYGQGDQGAGIAVVFRE